MFRSKASHLLKIIPDDDDQDDLDIRKVTARITKETKQLVPDLNSYATEISADVIHDDCSPTLLHLLSQISPKLGDTLQASLIGNVITSTVNLQATTLKVSLGLLMKDKSLIDKCYGFGITCSYDEVIRFKASAAQAASQKINLLIQGVFDNETGLVQAVAENFDATISSPIQWLEINTFSFPSHPGPNR